MGRKQELEPALVAGLVRSLGRAATGTGSWLHEGALARHALRCWRHLDPPSAAAWDRHCIGIASAWEGGRLRRFFRKGWAWTPRGLVALLRLHWARAIAELEANIAAPLKAPPAAVAAAWCSGLRNKDQGAVRTSRTPTLPPWYSGMSTPRAATRAYRTSSPQLPPR